MKELLIASAAFALFILCPRMAGMTSVISDAGHGGTGQSSGIWNRGCDSADNRYGAYFSEIRAHCGFSILCNHRFCRCVCDARDKHESGNRNFYTRIVCDPGHRVASRVSGWVS